MDKGLAEKHLIYKILSGSRAYGFSTPESDYDYRGIFIPPEEYFLGLRAFDILDTKNDEDCAYYSLRQFAHLAIANNPNVLEMLFVDPEDILLCRLEFAPLIHHRDAFLSQRCAKTYVGYASAQLHRIHNHKRWISQELRAMEILWPLVINEKVCREWVQWRFGSNVVERMENEFASKMQLPSTSLDCYLSWRQQPKTEPMDAYLSQMEDTGLAEPDERSMMFFREKEYLNGKCLVFDELKFKEAKKKRQQYTEWMARRDPKRHESEVKFGYDTRHAAHLIRLLRTGYEILTEGKLLVRRPDAQELLSIRQGTWSYEKAVDYADEMINKINEIKDFAVPESPDFKLINDLIIQTTKEVLWPAMIGNL